MPLIFFLSLAALAANGPHADRGFESPLLVSGKNSLTLVNLLPIYADRSIFRILQSLLMADPPVRKSSTEITVRSWTLDIYGQVSNAKFLEFLEEARWNHFQGFFESGMFMDLGLAFMLVNVNLNYSDAAYLGDVLDIETTIKRIGEKSITLFHCIQRRQDGTMILDGEVTFVVKDLKKGVAVPITGRMRDMFVREQR